MEWVAAAARGDPVTLRHATVAACAVTYAVITWRLFVRARREWRASGQRLRDEGVGR